MMIQKPASLRDRRQFGRLFAAAATAALSLVLSTKSSKASGRHSDPDYDGGPECILRGTRVLTERGLKPVEHLSSNDCLILASGEIAPIKWVGCSTFKLHPTGSTRDSIAPIRIARSAISDNVPERDLYVSPAHAIYIDAVLIPAKYLVNGMSIQNCALDSRTIEYWHVQTDGYAVMLAGGMPIETLAPGAKLARAALVDPLNSGKQAPFARVLCYNGGRQEGAALLRSLISAFFDVRDPIQRAFDKLTTRAAQLQ